MRRALRLAARVLLIAIGASCSLTGVTRAAGWSIVASPNPVASQGSLAAVSCSGANSCTAVGGTLNSAGTPVALVERWNGSGWSVQATPNPRGSSYLPGYAFLSAVSCSSATSCTAVGDYVDAGGTDLTLAEHWNGTGWSVQATPNPAGVSYAIFRGVSCASDGTCLAVGYYNSSGQNATLSERWDGSRWSLRSSLDPAGNRGVGLAAVSCSSGSACTAAGDYLNSAGVDVTLAERWNGSGWSIQPTPNPGGATSSYYLGVSCASASVCTAVGVSNTAGHNGNLAARWNGSRWSPQTVPNPAGNQGSGLAAVTCGAAGCTAVGDYINGAGTDVTLAEHATGSAGFTIQPTANPAGTKYSYLSGVWCGSGTTCTAVGTTNGGRLDLPLVEGFKSSGWSLGSPATPSGAQDSSLTAVSCSSPTACTAVGHYVSHLGGHVVTLAERWNGSSWTIQPTPYPTGAKGSRLLGVSCVSSSSCTAAGSYDVSDKVTQSLAESWNGSIWTIKTTPNPANAPGYAYSTTEFKAVSCSSPSSCTAAGYYSNGNCSNCTLAERWNGRAWSIQTTQDPSGTGTFGANFLSGVSCNATASCTAVGRDDAPGPFETLVEHWSGSSWSVQSSPSPGASWDSLEAVSCAPASPCTSVGDYDLSSGTFATLAERSNGSSWVIQPTPTASGVNTFLDGVSCPTATVCTAVGSAAHVLTVAERWSGGSWSAQPIPNPGGSKQLSLYGVSCSTATTCAAAGDYINSAGVDTTLVESYAGTAAADGGGPNADAALQNARPLLTGSAGAAQSAPAQPPAGSEATGRRPVARGAAGAG